LGIYSNLLGFSGKSEQIVVSNDKSRLTQEQIDKMIADGDKFAAEDELHKKRTEALNGLSSFVYSLKSQLGDKDGMGAKLDRADKTKLQTIINEGSEWIDEYGKEATLEELEEKLAGVYTFHSISLAF
jgi:heat shock protein 5